MKFFIKLLNQAFRKFLVTFNLQHRIRNTHEPLGGYLNPKVKQNNEFEDTFKAADVHLYHAPMFTSLREHRTPESLSYSFRFKPYDSTRKSKIFNFILLETKSVRAGDVVCNIIGDDAVYKIR